MSDDEERMAAISARECAGWNGDKTVDVWCVDPCLTGSFDEIYFEDLDEQRLEVTAHIPIVIDNGKTPGADKTAPRR